MPGRSESRVRRIRVATTREEFNACFASGEAFEASHELAAQMGFFPPPGTLSATKSSSHCPMTGRAIK